jgi:hypothetical protein
MLSPANSLACIFFPSSFYIALLHAGNAAPPNLADSAWQRLPIEEVSRRLGLDRQFYVTLRSQPSPRSLPQVDFSNTLNLAAPFIVYDGYGSVAEYLALGMARCGASVNVVPTRMDPAGISEEFKQLLDRSHPEPTAPTLCFCWPLENLTPFRHARELFMYTMWESASCRGWAKFLNHAGRDSAISCGRCFPTPASGAIKLWPRASSAVSTRAPRRPGLTH